MKPLPLRLFALTCTITIPLLGQSTPDQQLSAETLLANANIEQHIAWQAAEDKVQAEGRTFQAWFDPQGAAIETVPMPSGVSPRLELRYLGSQRGAVHASATAQRNPKLTDKIVRYQRGNVVETYTVSPNGFEQSFHIAARPAGSGDLTLAIGVGGNVTAPVTPSAHQAIEFAIDGSRQIRYGEAIAFDRAGHRIEVATSYDGNGRIDLTVPHGFLETAAFPIVVDPAVGPVFIADSNIFNDTKPDVAYATFFERYMVVWQRQFPTSVGIRAQLFDKNGVPMTSYIPVATSATAGSPSIAGSTSIFPNAFFVVWEQDNAIRGRMVSLDDGSFPAPTYAISEPGPGEQDSAPTVSGPGRGTMLVAWERKLAGDNQARGVRLRDITYLDTYNPLSYSRGPERAITTVGSGYVRNVRLSSSNVRSAGLAGDYYHNRIIWDRWWPVPVPGDWDVYSCAFRVQPATSNFLILDPAGPVLGANVPGVNESNGDIGARAPNWFSTDDLQYCIAWEDEGDVHLRMYDLAGDTGPEIVVDDSPNFEGDPSVGAGYCEFTIAYLSVTSPSEFDVDIRAARVLLDGTVAINRRLVDDPGTQFQNGIAASSRPAYPGTVARTNTSMLVWMGQTGPAGTGLNDVRGRMFEPNAPTITPFGAACPGPLGELPLIGTTSEAPTSGSVKFGVTISGAPTDSIAVLLIGDLLQTAPVPGAPGCNLYMGLPFVDTMPIVTDAAGNGIAMIPIPCSIPSGTVLAFQWGVYTPKWNPFGWITSYDIDIRWSHW